MREAVNQRSVCAFARHVAVQAMARSGGCDGIRQRRPPRLAQVKEDEDAPRIWQRERRGQRVRAPFLHYWRTRTQCP
eukprot:scaffold143855_cov244-Phaeocystis_antarctica.AAC.1